MTIPQASNDDSQAAKVEKSPKMRSAVTQSILVVQPQIKLIRLQILSRFQKCNKKGGNSQPFRSYSRLTGV